MLKVVLGISATKVIILLFIEEVAVIRKELPNKVLTVLMAIDKLAAQFSTLPSERKPNDLEGKLLEGKAAPLFPVVLG